MPINKKIVPWKMSRKVPRRAIGLTCLSECFSQPPNQQEYLNTKRDSVLVPKCTYLNVSSNAFDSLRSRVSKPSVKLLQRGETNSCTSIERPREINRRPRLVAARSSYDLAPIRLASDILSRKLCSAKSAAGEALALAPAGDTPRATSTSKSPRTRTRYGETPNS